MIPLTIGTPTTLVSLSLFLMILEISNLPPSFAQRIGEQAEMDRLEQQADDLSAQGDPEGAALAIGKAAMMAELLISESRVATDGKIYQAASLLYRAEELGFRALALFKLTGGTPPAPAGVCHYLYQGHHKLTDSKDLLEDASSESPKGFNDKREKLLLKTEEWEGLLLGLQEDLACADISNS